VFFVRYDLFFIFYFLSKKVCYLPYKIIKNKERYNFTVSPNVLPFYRKPAQFGASVAEGNLDRWQYIVLTLIGSIIENRTKRQTQIPGGQSLSSS
jgi:hypothetical protein